MNIKCPECGQDHDVPNERIPAEKFRASCRGCSAQFVVAVESCNVCGVRVQKGQGCLVCLNTAPVEDLVLVSDVEVESVVDESGHSEMDDEGAPFDKRTRCSHQVEFSGLGGEFFRIWIVNLFLTIITLGIYTPWAKVRTRQYFYNHTTLADEPFEYLADPMILLRGYIIIAVGFFIYSATQLMPIVNGIMALIFYGVFPLLVFKSLRFYAHNSSFKNIRFQFLGSVSEAYTTYLALPIAIPLTAGFIIPYWMYYRKKYFFENFAFGGARCEFSAKVKPFYWIYFKAALMMLAPLFLIGVVAAVVVPMVQGSSGGNLDEGLKVMLIGVGVIVYAGFLLGYTFIQQYVYAKTTNYCWEMSDLGDVCFESTLVPTELMKIQAVNILAILFSAGLLYPWAKVRKTKYILENLTLHVTGSLDDFTASNAHNEAALGDAAMDFFDFEIGL